MKTFILFLLTLFVGAAAYFSMDLTGNPYPIWMAGIGITILFTVRAVNKARKLAIKREQQRLFNEWFRNHGGFRRSY